MTRPAADLALLRFLRARVDETVVLNDAAEVPPAPPGLSGMLMQAARGLIAGGSRNGIDYGRIAASPAFAAYRVLTRALPAFDPASLDGRRERTAFWINIYNALVIDAVISLGLRDSIREAPGFFRRAAYRIGPYRFALDEIEHGLLRGNRPAFGRLPPPFPPDDPRLALGPGLLDPRIHFALNCGTHSCPPVAFYDAARLDAQLDAAAASFVNAEGVRLEGGEALLSPLFSFYEEDFGDDAGAREWVLRYLTEPDLRTLVAAAPLRIGEYDWSLNRGLLETDDVPAHP